MDVEALWPSWSLQPTPVACMHHMMAALMEMLLSTAKLPTDLMKANPIKQLEHVIDSEVTFLALFVPGRWYCHQGHKLSMWLTWCGVLSWLSFLTCCTWLPSAQPRAKFCSFTCEKGGCVQSESMSCDINGCMQCIASLSALQCQFEVQLAQLTFSAGLKSTLMCTL